MSELLNALRRNLANREEIGDEETAELLRGRIVDEEKAAKQADKAEVAAAEVAAELADLSKAELVERAEAAGVETKGLNKAELVEALEGTTT